MIDMTSAQKDIAKGEYNSYSVVIVAPEKYLGANKEAQKYEHKVKYEQMREHFLSKSDARSKYKLALIDRAIFEQKNGYQWEANPGVVSFMSKMNAYKKTKYPALPDGTISWWPVYFTILNNASIVFKANKGFCDLQFSHTEAKDLLSRVKDLLSDNMQVVQAGKSASVRIAVMPIWFGNQFEDKLSEVDEALEAIHQLNELAKELSVKES